ncbi:MAG: hypothetical protein LBD51_03095 [Bifidobacteriaceae bacterium]|jgi:hypothetical protein|nr:hypothetical protein [Bifidobacteriaceae bacterium]
MGLGIPGAQALWYDAQAMDGGAVPRGVVGFAAARVVDTGDTPLVDAARKKFSTHGAYADRADIAKSADQGAALSAQLTGDDAEAAAEGNIIYVQYVVNGLAVGNSRLTYVARLDGKGLAGVTAGAAARLYLVPKDYNFSTSSCEDFFTAVELEGLEPAASVSYAGNGAQNDSPGQELVDYPATTGQHIWCLRVAPASGQYRNDASIEVDTEVGVKSDSDSWTVEVTRTTDGEDQLRVSFTPTVSRWN